MDREATLTVIIAEDEQPSALYFKKICEDFGLIVVDVVSSGGRLIESYIEHRPDLILTDIELSRKSGIEACQELQAKGFDINVIFITGASDVLYPELTSEIGNIGYLVKPVTKERLINFLEKAKKKILRETSPIDTSNIKWIQARVNYRYTQVNEESIIYVEKASKYRSLLYLMKSEGYEVMESSSTLKELEIQCSDKIFRAHKSFLVNIQHVHRVEPDQNTVGNYILYLQYVDTRIPVSRRSIDNLLAAQRYIKTFR